MTRLIIPAGAGSPGIVVADPTTNHARLRNLEFADSGHTGFQAELTFDAAPTENSDNPVKSGGVYSALSGKVDKVSGKGLSKNDFTDELKNKLDGIATGAEVNVQADWNQSSGSADDYIKNKPDLSLKENISNKVTTIDMDSTDDQYPAASSVYFIWQQLDSSIEDITPWSEELSASQAIDNDRYAMEAMNNGTRIYTSDNFSVLEIDIASGEYPYTYKSRVSFNSPSPLPTSVIYSASSELLTWTGTDCYVFNNNSVFRPQAGKHYDIDFYFNGSQFVGKVNGYVLATGQETPTDVAIGSNSWSLTNCLDDFSMKEFIIMGKTGGDIGDTNYFNIETASKWNKLGNANKVTMQNNTVIGTSLTTTAYQYIAKKFITSGSPLLGTTITVSFGCKLVDWTRTTSLRLGYFNSGGTFTTITGGSKDNISNGTYVYTFAIPNDIPEGADGFYLLWYTGFSSSSITVGQKIELSDIMVLLGSYNSTTIPLYIPYGKYGIPFTVTSSGITEKKLITLDSPITVNESLDIDYDRRRATKINIQATPPEVDVTSQIDWLALPNTKTGDVTIATNVSFSPDTSTITYYISGGN